MKIAVQKMIGDQICRSLNLVKKTASINLLSNYITGLISVLKNIFCIREGSANFCWTHGVPELQYQEKTVSEAPGKLYILESGLCLTPSDLFCYFVKI